MSLAGNVENIDLIDSLNSLNLFSQSLQAITYINQWLYVINPESRPMIVAISD